MGGCGGKENVIQHPLFFYLKVILMFFVVFFSFFFTDFHFFGGKLVKGSANIFHLGPHALAHKSILYFFLGNHNGSRYARQ